MAKKRTQRVPLPDALRQAIIDSGKSSYELREETGVNHGVILRFLSGERDIRLQTAEKLAMAVGLSLKRDPERHPKE